MKLLIPFVLSTALFAQQQSMAPDRPVVRARGTATVTAKPDQVQVNVGVVSQAQTAQAAGAANAKQVADVIAEIKRVAGAGAQIQTVNYSVNPNYRYPKDGGTPTITGYTATNMVQVTSPDIPGVSKVIDAATKTGANNIHGVNFSIKDEQSVRAEALRKATQQARASAEAMAAALGLKASRVVRIEDSSPGNVQPMREMMQMRGAVADAVSTPIEPGTIQIQANVLITLELAQ